MVVLVRSCLFQYCAQMLSPATSRLPISPWARAARSRRAATLDSQGPTGRAAWDHRAGAVRDEDVQDLGAADAVQNLDAEAVPPAVEHSRAAPRPRRRRGAATTCRAWRRRAPRACRHRASARRRNRRALLGDHLERRFGVMRPGKWTALAPTAAGSTARCRSRRRSRAWRRRRSRRRADLEDRLGVEFGADVHVVLQMDTAFGEAGAAGAIEPQRGVVARRGRGRQLRRGALQQRVVIYRARASCAARRRRACTSTTCRRKRNSARKGASCAHRSDSTTSTCARLSLSM